MRDYLFTADSYLLNRYAVDLLVKMRDELQRLFVRSCEVDFDLK